MVTHNKSWSRMIAITIATLGAMMLLSRCAALGAGDSDDEDSSTTMYRLRTVSEETIWLDGDITYAYTYEGANESPTQILKTTSDSDVTTTWTYTYDGQKNRLRMIESESNQEQDLIADYTYGEMNRRDLVEAFGPFAHVYYTEPTNQEFILLLDLCDWTELAFSGRDNYTKTMEFNEKGLPSSDGYHQFTYDYDAAGRPIKQYANGDASRRFDYDAAGNLIKSQWYTAEGQADENTYHTFSYDGQNRLTEEIFYTNGIQWETTQFDYDAAGNCVKQKDFNGADQTLERTLVFTYESF